MTINEKAVYLKGLADGLSFDKDSAEGKLIAALIDLCSDMAKKLEEVDDDVEYLNDYIEEIDEDLGDVEEYLFGDDECDCDCCDEDCCAIECPACGETLHFSCDTKPEDLVCPKCGERLAILDEFEDEDK